MEPTSSGINAGNVDEKISCEYIVEAVEIEVTDTDIPKNSQQEEDPMQEGNLESNNSQTLLESQRNEALISLYTERFRKISTEVDIHYESYLKTPTLHTNFIQEWKKFYREESFKIAVYQNYKYIESSAWKIYWKSYIDGLKNEELWERSKYLQNQLKIPPSLLRQRVLKSKFSDLSDISEDELEAPASKRPKLNTIDPSPPSFTELDRMLIAYELAYEHLQTGKHLSPQELSHLVKAYCEGGYNKVGLEARQQNLTDEDLLLIYKNLRNLSENEHENFLSFMNTLRSSDLARYMRLSGAFESSQDFIN